MFNLTEFIGIPKVVCQAFCRATDRLRLIRVEHEQVEMIVTIRQKFLMNFLVVEHWL